MKLTPSMLRLYAVTDRSWSADEADFWRRVSEAMEGGAQVVQLREKHLSHEAMLRAAERFVALCRKCGAVSIINDDVEAAVASGADGVHVGQEDLEAGRARALLGRTSSSASRPTMWRRLWPPRRRERIIWAWARPL